MTAQPPSVHEYRRRHLLAVLHAAGRPLTTQVLRDRLNARINAPAHHESVYRILLVLEHRRLIRRQQLPGRHVAWELLPARPPLSARVPGRHPRVAAETPLTESARRAGTTSVIDTRAGGENPR